MARFSVTSDSGKRRSRWLTVRREARYSGLAAQGIKSMSAGPAPIDGKIDFSGYSLTQLEELRFNIDRSAFPQNFANLIAEIERRRVSDGSQPVAEMLVEGRFTSRDGLAGWIQAKLHWLPFYGAGAVIVTPVEVVLRAWQRTWLGVPIQAERRLPVTGMRNVAAEGTRVRFEFKASVLPARKIEFITASEHQARELVARLPTTQTPGFQKRWSDITEFNRRLAAVGGRPWITPALVLANTATFITMAVATGDLGAFAPSTILDWGANYGPLTVNGQWWRLFSALFVHFNVLHLSLNVWALWGVGCLAERLYGRWAFAFIYFTTGGLASLTSIAWDPSHSSVGASGAIFGVLGAFLAFLSRNRHSVPAAIVRAHWRSTLAFVLFNLLSGGLQQGIDNAAHVGGLISGAVIGWILARPLSIGQRSRFPALRSAVAAAFVVAVVLAAQWQVRGMGAQLTPYEQYLRNHAWYVNAEGRNLQLWQELAQRAAAGNISAAELSRSFERDIAPFWKTAHERLSRVESVPADQQSMDAIVKEFVRLRLEWARALIDATRDRDETRARDSVRLMHETGLVQARIDRLALQSRMQHRPRALATTPLVMKMRALLPWNRWECVRAPVFYGRVAPSDSQTDGPAARDTAACLAQRLFMLGDYAALDALMKRTARARTDLPDGGSTVEALFGGLSVLFEYGGLQVDDVFGRVTDWRLAQNDSIEAHLVEAILFQDWAWSARGHGTAREVTPQAWLLFEHRTEMAATSLREVATRAADNPMWHVLSLDVGLDKSLAPDEIRLLFDRGRERFPDFLRLHRSMLRVLMPRWRGSYEEIDRFINEMSVMKDGGRDFAEYAQLYWMYQSLERDDINVFDDARADWPTVKRGFEGLIARHPQSDFLLNGFASLACLAGDVAQYDSLRPHTEKRMSSTAWFGKHTMGRCDSQMAKKRREAGS
jgi:membrane associated rhomboid family serine protease